MADALHTRLLKAIAVSRQNKVAEAMGIDATAMHRIVKGDQGVKLKDMEKLLAALNMTVIDCTDGETVTIPRGKYQALRALSLEALQNDTTGEGDE